MKFLKTEKVEMVLMEKVLMLQSASSSVMNLTVTKITSILTYPVRATASDVSAVLLRRIILGIILAMLILHAGQNHQTLPYWSSAKLVQSV